jgi:homoserine dehydrogenase
VSKEQINVGILGLGVVGSGTVRVLTENAEDITRKVGMPVVIKKVAVRDLTKKRGVTLPPEILTDNPSDVIDDPDIDILCELVGGVDPIHDYVLRAIRSGKHIVTANKEMMAKSGHALLHEAEQRGLDFNFEASVAGGIPIIQAMKQALAANRFSLVMGIMNGTTNYILSRMTAEDAEFADVLADAQKHGYAEPDPTNDVEGYDAQYKIAILSSIAFTSRVDLADIYVEGITKIGKRDIEVAKDLGYVIKIVGIGQDTGDAVQVRVHPVLLPKSHPLAAVNDVYNAIFAHGNAVGDVMFYGRGAGSMPTGSAVVGDIIEIARNIRQGGSGRIGCTCYLKKPALPIDRLRTKYYVRVLAHDRPRVLASLAGIFGDFDVSIESVVQKTQPNGDAEIVWITHKTLEANLRNALDVLGKLGIVNGIENCIRVQE